MRKSKTHRSKDAIMFYIFFFTFYPLNNSSFDAREKVQCYLVGRRRFKMLNVFSF